MRHDKINNQMLRQTYMYIIVIKLISNELAEPDVTIIQFPSTSSCSSSYVHATDIEITAMIMYLLLLF